MNKKIALKCLRQELIQQLQGAKTVDSRATLQGYLNVSTAEPIKQQITAIDNMINQISNEVVTKVKIASFVTVVDSRGDWQRFLLTPTELGGMHLMIDDANVLCISTSAPVGRNLFGLEIGDFYMMADKEYRINSIQ